jgi:Streptomyces sporulation and cell division protein, SsgA
VQQGDVVVDVVVSRAVPPVAPIGSASPAPLTPVVQRRAGERITVLTLSWRRDDPMAVHLILRSTPDHPALPRGSWVVLRDFLRYGLEEPTGDGAVHIQPDPFRQRVQLRLARAGRPAWISAPCSVLRSFLDQTDALDPTGEERSAEALDAVIDRLLRR